MIHWGTGGNTASFAGQNNTANGIIDEKGGGENDGSRESFEDSERYSKPQTETDTGEISDSSITIDIGNGKRTSVYPRGHRKIETGTLGNRENGCVVSKGVSI